MAKPVTTIRALIGLWATASALAEDLKVKPGRVRQWANRNRIPGQYWSAMVDSAKRHDIVGVSLALIARLHPQAPADSPPLSALEATA